MVELALATLAVYRLASLLALEDGPFDGAIKLRTAVFVRYGEDHWLFRGITCPKCVSFWLSWIICLFLWQTWAQYVLASLGIAGANLLLFQTWESR